MHIIIRISIWSTNVLAGACSKLKISSLLMPYSTAPGISGYLGLPPTAITKLSATNVSV